MQPRIMLPTTERGLRRMRQRIVRKVELFDAKKATLQRQFISSEIDDYPKDRAEEIQESLEKLANGDSLGSRCVTHFFIENMLDQFLDD